MSQMLQMQMQSQQSRMQERPAGGLLGGSLGGSSCGLLGGSLGGSSSGSLGGLSSGSLSRQQDSDTFSGCGGLRQGGSQASTSFGMGTSTSSQGSEQSSMWGNSSQGSDRSWGKGEQSWSKGEQSWGKNDRSWGKSDQSWGKSDQSWGNNDHQSWGNNDQSWGNSEQSWKNNDQSWKNNEQGWGNNNNGSNNNNTQLGGGTSLDGGCGNMGGCCGQKGCGGGCGGMMSGCGKGGCMGGCGGKGFGKGGCMGGKGGCMSGAKGMGGLGRGMNAGCGGMGGMGCGAGTGMGCGCGGMGGNGMNENSGGSMSSSMGMGQGMPAGAAGKGGIRFSMMSAPRPGMQQMGMAARPSAAPGLGAGAGGPGPKFPAALQKWLQRLFAATGGEADPNLQKQTHIYLRNWVQQWVKTGELWQRNWEVAALPSAEEIRRNLPPGALSGGGSAGSSPQGVPMTSQPKAAPGVQPSNEGFSPRGLDGRRPGSRTSPFRRRSRSRSEPRRRQRQRSSSSSRSSRSRRRNRSRSRSGGRSRSPNRPWWAKDAGKGKGKEKGKGKGSDKKDPSEELREKIRLHLNSRIEESRGRPQPKELQEEIRVAFNCPPNRFQKLFQQSVGQYVNTYLGGGPEAAWPMAKDEKELTQGERDMRAQRAARFQSHLNEKKEVAMVSFNESEGGSLHGGPIIGELEEMCSRHEAKEREMTRQLDKFEWKKGTDPKNPEVNLALATRKYQRSSADKAYRSSDTRSLAACWRTMEFLMTEILDFDCNPKPAFAVQSVSYIEVYSYLRDRTRSLRVDLHLQQPRSTTQRVFTETHECCLRFEILSLFLLLGRGNPSADNSTEKYDTKLGLKAISQTIEPLLNAYQAIRDKQLAKSILAEVMGGFGEDEDGDQEDYTSPWEMAAHRYIVLLLMSFSPDEVSSHLSKMSRELLSHPLVSFATKVYAAFHTDDYATFLRMYRDADFLSAVAMSGIADLARLRALWLLVRTYPQPIGDKVSLARMKNILAFASDDHAKSFLAFHGLQLVIDEASDGGAHVILPKKGTPEAAALALLQGPARLPEKCDFPKGADSLLVAKFEALGLSRADIVFGSADPMVPIPVEAEVPQEAEDGGVQAEVPEAAEGEESKGGDTAEADGAEPEGSAKEGGEASPTEQ
eukprot:TRINITY_DN7093_c0_g1_i1.p1 TRINITY_DN7093_c0_g1~~TRINITY_DN7093_c0_g1_i1.p1  ORF type:complete len:1264 (-),score=254.11 TRINITY_DN7093_c0_g1_i1:46-3477(-)